MAQNILLTSNLQTTKSVFETIDMEVFKEERAALLQKYEKISDLNIHKRIAKITKSLEDCMTSNVVLIIQTQNMFGITRVGPTEVQEYFTIQETAVREMNILLELRKQHRIHRADKKAIDIRERRAREKGKTKGLTEEEVMLREGEKLYLSPEEWAAKYGMNEEDIKARSSPPTNPGIQKHMRNKYFMEYNGRLYAAKNNKWKIFDNIHYILPVEVFVETRMQGMDYVWAPELLQYRKVLTKDHSTIVKKWQLEPEDFIQLITKQIEERRVTGPTKSGIVIKNTEGYDGTKLVLYTKQVSPIDREIVYLS